MVVVFGTKKKEKRMQNQLYATNDVGLQEKKREKKFSNQAEMALRS